jgi:hypothetical protein
MLVPNVRMPELGVDLVGVDGGVDVLEEMIRVGSTAAHPIPVGVVAAPEGADPAPAPANAGGGRVMRWNNNTSGFVLRRMAQLVSDGSRPDKVFKDKDVNYVAKCLKEFCGEIVSPTQVYNHLRKWRQKWARVAKLKDLSGALWDSDTNAIMLEQEHYLGHCKVDEFTSFLCVLTLFFVVNQL